MDDFRPTVALTISAAAASTIASDVFMFDSFQPKTILSVRKILTSHPDSRCGICHAVQRQGISRGDGVAPACALSLRGDFKHPLRTFWRLEPHGLEEPNVCSRRIDGAEGERAAEHKTGGMLHVCFGSKADRHRLIQHVRLLPDSGLKATHRLSPLGAISRLGARTAASFGSCILAMSRPSLGSAYYADGRIKALNYRGRGHLTF